MNTPAPRILGFVVLAGVSLILGYLAGRNWSEPGLDDRVEDSATPSTVDPSTEVIGIPGVETTVEKPASTVDSRSPIERINEIAENDRFGIRRFQYRELIDTMTADEVSSLVAELKEDRAKKDRDILMHFAFNHWGEIAGESALNEALSLRARERPLYAASALGGWSRTDQEEAWQRTVGLADEWPAFASRAGQVMSELVRTDLQDAISRRDDVSKPNGKSAIQRSIIEYAAQEGRLGDVLAQVIEFESIEDQKVWTRGIFAQWGQSESDAPLHALSKISDPALAQSAMGGFLGGWIQVDPLGAVDYALENADDPAIEGNLPQVIRQATVGADRERILEVIEQVAAGGRLDHVASMLVPSMGFTNPDIALGIVNMLSDEQQQNRLTSSVMFSWVQRDFEGAVAHYEQMSSLPKKQMSIPAVAFGALPREDGGAHISRWVHEFPSGDERSKAVEMLLSQASNPTRLLSESSKAALLDLVRESPNLSDQAFKSAQKLFGADFNPVLTPATP